MVRELREETGLIVRATGLAGIYSERPRPGLHGIRIMYYAEVLGGQLAFERDGTTDRCEWISFTEIADYVLVDPALRGVELALKARTAVAR